MGRDVEADLRAKLADSARTFVVLIGRGGRRTPRAWSTAWSAMPSVTPHRLRDAVALLGEDEQAPRAAVPRGPLRRGPAGAGAAAAA